MDNACAPQLNLPIKLHKINKLIRPLINTRTASNYKIAKFLTQILKHKLKLPSNTI